MDASTSRQSRRSRKGSCLIVSISTVNWMWGSMWGSMELMCGWNWSMYIARAQQVSSIGTDC